MSNKSLKILVLVITMIALGLTIAASAQRGAYKVVTPFVLVAAFALLVKVPHQWQLICQGTVFACALALALLGVDPISLAFALTFCAFLLFQSRLVVAGKDGCSSSK